MPNCFQLTPKANPEAGPSLLTDIDASICKSLNVPCDPDKWYLDWYNIIGFALACGRTFEQLRERYKDDPRYLEIVDYLDQNYTVSCWAEIGRR